MLAKQIKNLRTNAGMSQLQLAKKLNVGPSAVGMYEQGRRTPSIDIIILIARTFGVSLDYLLLGTETCGSVVDTELAVAGYRCYYKICCPYLKRKTE